ncbi:MAG: C25 family peptidase propeptide domain-containing protein, partial [Thermoplasmatota archaeon]
MKLEKNNFKKLKSTRTAIGVIICIFLLLTSVATTMGNFIESNSNNKTTSISYRFLFKEPSFKSIQPIQSNNNEFTLIDIPGCLSVGMQAGEPQIPIKIITLLLPPKKTISSINVIGTPVEIQSPINLLEKPVFPYQNPVPIGSDLPQEFHINTNIYSSSNLFPSTLITDYHIGYSHGYAIVNFGLNPLQYKPNEGRIIFYPELTVNINLKD